MEYFKLFLGLGLILGMTWLLKSNWRRRGWVNVLFRLDTLMAIAVGFYLVITSVQLLVH